MPELKNGSLVLGLNAPSKTFNLAANGFEDYFPNLVNVAKTPNANINGRIDGCNSCHDQLATTFHSGIRGGNIKVCRICHEVSSAGSHLELQSRSIDSYVHGIHSFQLFDPGDIDLDDPVAAAEAKAHIARHFPRFTIKDCEACHVSNTGIYAAGRRAYDVPDQHKSMPGVLSGSDVVEGREVGDISPSVTGPTVRACGACHRAQALAADDAGELATQRSHWQSFGTYIEAAADVLRATWEAVVAKLMPLFS
jgi:OmcA/MtrC family decaheme c-type cytochrome